MSEAVPRWQRMPEQRPAQILDAALEVFARKGFRGATMDEIALEAGITKGTVYLYFSNKEALFVEVVRAQFSHALDLFRAARLDTGQDPEAMARGLADSVLEVLMAPEVARVIPLVVAEFGHIPALREVYLRDVMPAVDLAVASMLRTGMELGWLRRVDPDIAARCLLGAFFSFVLTQEVFGAREVTPMARSAIVDTVVTIFSRGLLV